MKVKIKQLNPWAVKPTYATAGSVGFDLRTLEEVSIIPGSMRVIHTGWAFEIPVGYEMQIRPRSGISKMFPNYIMNSPGTIDSDYRGEVCLLIHNHTPNLIFHYDKGAKLAQGVIVPVAATELVVVGEITDTDRGSGGFGSTGV